MKVVFIHSVNHVISFCLKCSKSAELTVLSSFVFDSMMRYWLFLESFRWNFLPSFWILFETILVSHVELIVRNWMVEFSKTSITNIEIFIFPLVLLGFVSCVVAWKLSIFLNWFGSFYTDTSNKWLIGPGNFTLCNRKYYAYR